MKKIIVAVDGSEHAMRALEKAKEIGKAFNSNIVIVYVMNNDQIHLSDSVTQTMVMESVNALESEKKEGEALLARAKSVAEEFGSKVETVLLAGDASLVLLHFIKSSDADLVILGSHGVKGLRQFMLGSVVSKIIHHIEKTIMIVR
jgi:nucleotide-binding universal stress UspA family protein